MEQPTTTPSPLALAALLTGTFMVILDVFVVNVALPSLQRDLGAGAGSVEWIVAGYALSSGVLLVTGGRLGDRIGRRRTYALGLTVFSLASACCGAAWTPTMLVIARLVQGIGAALMTPNVLALLTATYTGNERVRAIKAYGLTMGLAAISGQLLGGVLITADPLGLGWRSCFLINVPVGTLALALVPRHVPESRATDSGSLDLTGAALLTLGLAAIMLPLVDGRQHGWPLWGWLSFAASVVIALLFALQQRMLAMRNKSSLIDFSLFGQRSIAAGLSTQLCFWCGQASYFLVLALYLQQGRNLSALQSGAVFTILAVSYVVASSAAPALLARHGRRLLTLGALTLAAGHALLLAAVAHVGVSGPVVLLAPGLLLAGAGMGLMIAPLTTVVLETVSAAQAGSASAALAITQNVGAALGIALTGIVFFDSLRQGYARAFELGLLQLAALLIIVASLTRLLPGRSKESAASAEPAVSEAG